MPPRRFASRSLLTLALAVLVSSATFAQANPPPAGAPSTHAGDVGKAIADASARFGVPELWIRAVIRAESDGDPRAVSRKGATGVMQIMPATFAALRAQLGLGSDPFNVHDNVIAGTAYLRLMFDRYGLVGMVGAYNAGPDRWDAYLAGTRTLPSETLAYLARLAPVLGFAAPAVQPRAPAMLRPSPLESPLFVTVHGGLTVRPDVAEQQRVLTIIASQPTLVAQPDSQPELLPGQANGSRRAGSPTVSTLADWSARRTEDGSAAPTDTLFASRTPR